MPATQSREDLLGLYQGETHRSSAGRTMAGKSAGATVIELGIMLGGAESSIATPGWCLRCRGSQDTQRSTSQYPKVFCSEHASRSSFGQRSLRSRWKTASACTSGWEISSCQSRNLLLHNKKERSSYGKQLKHMAELDASIQERDVETQVKST